MKTYPTYGNERSEEIAQCSRCGKVNPGVDYDYADDTGWDYQSVCCAAPLRDVTDGGEWNPEANFLIERRHNKLVGGH